MPFDFAFQATLKAAAIKAIGIVGFAFLIYGLLQKTSKKQYKSFLLGSLFLLAYSIAINDFIFIALNAVYSFVALLRLLGK